MPPTVLTAQPVKEMIVVYFEYRNGQYEESEPLNFLPGGYLFFPMAVASMGTSRALREQAGVFAK